MDFSKLSANEKLATYGAAAAIVGGVVSAGTYPGHYSLTWLSTLLAIGVLAVVFLPQFSPNTNLPGSKGSLLLVLGGAAAVVMAFLFLSTVAFTFDFDLISVFFIAATIGALVMGLAGWQEFQAEGGTFKLGSSAPASPPPAAPSEPAAPAAPAAPPAPAAPIAPAAPVAPAAPAAEPMEPSAPSSNMPASDAADEDDTTA